MPFKSDSQRKGFYGNRCGNNKTASFHARQLSPEEIKSRSADDKKLLKNLKPIPLTSNRLPVQVSIIVPQTELDREISSKKFNTRIKNTKTFMSDNFGGDTSVKGVGSFILKEKGKTQLIKENIVLVESSTTPKIYNQNRKLLANFIIKNQKTWKQNSIGYSVEGTQFIYPKQDFIAHDKKKKILIS